ncbi:hypothetical protein BH23VER1_BH23VER1_05090 [soil metagenome]
MKMTATACASRLAESFGTQILGTSEFRGETTVVLEAGSVVEVGTFCRDELGFDFLVDLSTVDNAGEDPRFEVVYELYSYQSLVSLRLKCKVAEDEAEVASVAEIWPTANWHEREAYDMMGIRFAGHPDLRRILMWEGYPYFPLRKEFPLGGKPSEMPDVAFTGVAPLEGGPFVTSPTTAGTVAREPRARDRG